MFYCIVSKNLRPHNLRGGRFRAETAAQEKHTVFAEHIITHDLITQTRFRASFGTPRRRAPAGFASASFWQGVAAIQGVPEAKQPGKGEHIASQHIIC